MLTFKFDSGWKTNSHLLLPWDVLCVAFQIQGWVVGSPRPNVHLHAGTACSLPRWNQLSRLMYVDNQLRGYQLCIWFLRFDGVRIHSEHKRNGLRGAQSKGCCQACTREIAPVWTQYILPFFNGSWWSQAVWTCIKLVFCNCNLGCNRYLIIYI